VHGLALLYRAGHTRNIARIYKIVVVKQLIRENQQERKNRRKNGGGNKDQGKNHITRGGIGERGFGSEK